jgi:hypothetical protein
MSRAAVSTIHASHRFDQRVVSLSDFGSMNLNLSARKVKILSRPIRPIKRRHCNGCSWENLRIKNVEIACKYRSAEFFDPTGLGSSTENYPNSGCLSPVFSGIWARLSYLTLRVSIARWRPPKPSAHTHQPAISRSCSVRMIRSRTSLILDACSEQKPG